MMFCTEYLRDEADGIILEMHWAVRHEARVNAKRSAPVDDRMNRIFSAGIREGGNPSIVGVVVSQNEYILVTCAAWSQFKTAKRD